MNEHLNSAIERQQVLISEINTLTNTINIKKEEYLKLQGVVEYLQSMNPEAVDTLNS